MLRKMLHLLMRTKVRQGYAWDYLIEETTTKQAGCVYTCLDCTCTIFVPDAMLCLTGVE